jgi:hypothetical protein
VVMGVPVGQCANDPAVGQLPVVHHQKVLSRLCILNVQILLRDLCCSG